MLKKYKAAETPHKEAHPAQQITAASGLKHRLKISCQSILTTHIVHFSRCSGVFPPPIISHNLPQQMALCPVVLEL